MSSVTSKDGIKRVKRSVDGKRINGYEYNGRFYNEIKAWNITRTVQQNAASVTTALQGAANPMNPQNPFPPQQPAAQASSQKSDDLPF